MRGTYTMSYHCCVPKCSSDSRYNKAISFHRLPSEKKASLRKEWIVKIRRDQGKSFQVKNGKLLQLLDLL